MMESNQFSIRPVAEDDRAAWLPLWDGYNAFYGRQGALALPGHITHTTWRRFLDANEPVFALVAAQDGALVGLAHYLFHRSTTRTEDVCYLNDLFVAPSMRGQGIALALIHAVIAAARDQGATSLYWQTHETNTQGRRLYDKVATRDGFIVYSRSV